MTRYVKEEELGKLYKFDELKELGVEVGDIVAYKSTKFPEGYSWNYILLRKDFPNNLDVALECYKDPRKPNETYGGTLGYHWCGSTGSFRFRLICEKEKDDFVGACINTLKRSEFWIDNDYKCQIIHAIKKYKLLPEEQVSKLNKKLKKKLGVDILKLYNQTYGY